MDKDKYNFTLLDSKNNIESTNELITTLQSDPGLGNDFIYIFETTKMYKAKRTDLIVIISRWKSENDLTRFNTKLNQYQDVKVLDSYLVSPSNCWGDELKKKFQNIDSNVIIELGH